MSGISVMEVASSPATASGDPGYTKGSPPPPLPHQNVLEIVFGRLTEILAQLPPGSPLTDLLAPIAKIAGSVLTVVDPNMNKGAERIAYILHAWSTNDVGAIDGFLLRQPPEPTAYRNYASWVRAQMTPAPALAAPTPAT